MADRTTSVTVASVPVTPVALRVESKNRTWWARICFWRGLRKGARFNPNTRVF